MTSEFLDILYYEFLVQGDVQRALLTLGQHLGAHGGSLLELGPQRAHIRAMYGIDPVSMTAYDSELGAMDPLYKVSQNAPRNEPLILSKHTDLKSVYHSDYHTLIHRPSEIGDIVGFQSVSSDAHLALSLYRPENRLFSKSDALYVRQLAPHISRCLRLLSQKKSLSETIFRTYGLTLKESEIIVLLQDGVTYERICAALKITRNTLKWHLKNIFEKLDVCNLAGLLVKIRT